MDLARAKRNLRRLPLVTYGGRQVRTVSFDIRRQQLLRPSGSLRYIKESRQYGAVRRRARREIRREHDTRTVVFVHLYYPEVWPLIARRLAALGDKRFDIVMTYPVDNRDFVASLGAQVGGRRLYAFEIPNWGRDVLPFMQLAPILRAKGYDYVLKLHTKKSPHRKDGRDWMSDMVTSLLPDKRGMIDELYEVLARPDTGIVGPAGQYTSLVVNFEANGPHMTRMLDRLYGRKLSYDVLQTRRAEQGFFAGTMFWARLDSLALLLDKPGLLLSYEPERGQIDATKAHAIERLFGVIQPLQSRKIYEISGRGIRETAYGSGLVPDWSDVYIGPKA